MLGKLSLDIFPTDPIAIGGASLVVLGTIVMLSVLLYFQGFSGLWNNWLTSVDHKKIGIMYLVTAVVMLFRGMVDAILMRSHLAVSVGDMQGYLPPDHYDQIFTAHGVIMIFFVAMPLMFGIINLILPLQIGARDVAFPFLNQLSFWLFFAGAVLMNLSIIFGEFAATGWLAYPPLSELEYSPGVGVDYFIWAIQISGIGSLLSGINFFVTILTMRAPGMTLWKMPIFSWTVLSSMSLVIIAFPILTVTLGLLFLDRFFGMHFFTSDFGGNAMMYVNLIWAWGHPEVYILILPAFGIFSEIVTVFAQKRLFGYFTMIWATIAITFLSFVVWVHHFFTMGAGANVNAFFGVMTMVIAIPTGVKVFNWLFTMYRGRIIYATPMLWTVGFLATFTLGGMTGVMLAVPGIDFQLHNSLFLVAHFHNTIIGGVVFGYFAGLAYWMPKIAGVKLNETWGKAAFWCWIVGFFVAFVPIYILGLMGMTRRLSHYDAESGWQFLLIIALIGVIIIALGFVLQVVQYIVSWWQRDRNRDMSGDPWNGRTLEWSIPSPTPFYNFAVIPTVESRYPYWDVKYGSQKNMKPAPYEDIHMPKNTSLGFIIGALSLVTGFAVIWHVMWFIPLGLLGVAVCLFLRSFDYETEYVIPAREVEAMDMERKRRQLA
jgi:cytochrome o ubiquinol oxidase subunit 1